MPNTMNVTDKLTELVNAKHAQALEAVQVLREYLNNVPVTGMMPLKSLIERPTAPATVKRGGYTDAVLAVISHEWASAQQIAEKTGLEIKRVRGVLNAPRLRAKLASKIIGDEKAYRFGEYET